MAASAGLLASALSGCSSETLAQWGRFGLPEAATDRAPFIGNLWVGAWIASLVVGVFVWGLILWVMVKYRRKHADESPRQTRYNLPLELLYTLVPFLIIGVLFFFTVHAQNGVLAKEQAPAHTVNVVGQKWSWTFNYMEADNPQVAAVVNLAGTVDKIPDLYLPVDQTVRFNLTSADVIHSFWIPAFYFKLDVIPGHPNSFDVTPDKIGTYSGKCAELCGTYHAAMLFTVHVVSEEEYVAYLNGLKSDPARVGEIKAPEYPNTVPSVPAAEEEHK
ncbi:MAG TPA: cytochrome c oxidase subunit II [Propionicimonas sp.]|nr:cytochrome c oxidase subunit II [Propionicimonas sp.]HRA06936.1 cytochrome c oxidase subunit II [Propionicimonas sp.]